MHRMTKWGWSCVASAVLLLAAASVRAQSTDGSRVFLDAVPFAGASLDAPRLDLYLAVPAGILTFERSGETFTATYRVRLEVYSGERRLFDTTFDRETSTKVAEIARAQRASFDFYQLRVPLAPGTYDVRAQIVDTRSSFVASAHREAVMTTFTGTSMAMSGLLLVDRIREDSSGFVITPRMGDGISGDGEPYFVFFETYNTVAHPVDARLEATYRMPGARSAAARRTFERTIAPGRTQQWLQLDASEVPRGGYMLEMRIAPADDTSRTLARTERTIQVEAGQSGMPVGEAELDERITQMRHVAIQTEIETIREGRTYAEKRQRFAEFWRQRDPSPGTTLNEALVEYYARVDYAREHFGGHTAGWMTDQGRIYVIYGPPDNVARDPFRSDGRRIETWHYHGRGNEQIVFEDPNGFGDYRLVTPISTLEKYSYGG